MMERKGFIYSYADMFKGVLIGFILGIALLIAAQYLGYIPSFGG